MASGGGTGSDSSWLQRFLGPLGGMLGVDMEAVSANMASSGESDAIINCAMLAIFVTLLATVCIHAFDDLRLAALPRLAENHVWQQEHSERRPMGCAFADPGCSLHRRAQGVPRPAPHFV